MLRVAALATVAVAFAACSASKQQVHTAQHSLYDTDFAQVYSATLDATRSLYPNIDDNPGTGRIDTAWHPVPYAASNDDAQNVTPTPGGAMGAGNPGGGLGGGSVPTSPAAGAAGMGTRMAYKHYYVRFEIAILGGRPWRVKVIGHAASWDVGAAMPTELHGAARPPWLTPRTEALQVEIYKKMRKFAVPAHDEDTGSGSAAEDEIKTDPGEFKGVPADAAKALAQLKDALAKRDNDAIKPLLADDVVWGAGGAPGADTAMAMWQADPDSFDQMARLVGDACVADGAKRVKCPGGDPVPGQYQLVLEPRNGAWKVSSFLRAEP
jgi:hypothetical protein|nr:nuclear transport factor 2 family protein [Kofleriaceae bacterium]